MGNDSTTRTLTLTVDEIQEIQMALFDRRDTMLARKSAEGAKKVGLLQVKIENQRAFDQPATSTRSAECRISFEQFQALRTFTEDLGAESHLHGEGLDGVPGHLYDGRWISQFERDGQDCYQTVLGNHNPSSTDLEEIEREVYDYFREELNDNADELLARIQELNPHTV